MSTRDGVRLDADVYYPDTPGEFPVLLMRQPYGRAIASTVVYAHPTWYAAHGYIVVIQDVRGRGTSEGTFDLFAHEIDDGEDTVNWVATLPRAIGRVGMYGFSYQGMTQLYAAAAQSPALATICPAMIGYDLYHDWAYEGSAFCLQTSLSWAMQLAAETARRQGKGDAYRTLYVSARAPSLGDPVCARSGILKQLAPDSFYHDWLQHSEPGDYWEKLSPKNYMGNIDLPMLHIGGWFDAYLRGTLKFYREMASRSIYPQHLWVGPWAHLPWGRRVGAVDFGVEANSPIDGLQIRWFDHVLKDIDTGMFHELPVCLFEMGRNQWRSLPRFPDESSSSYFMSSSGLAALSDVSGRLVESLPSSSEIPDVLVHDPWRPVPASGGHAAFPSGSFDRAELDCRTDILTYTSDPLPNYLHLAGSIVVELYCTADSPSFDICAVFSEVHPDGSVFNLCQGYCRIDEPLKASAQATAVEAELMPLTEPYRIRLQPTCAQIAKGNAFRLSLSAACFPAYAVNPGTGSSPSTGRLMDARVVTLMMYTGDRTPSKILLPIVSLSSENS